jgi:hypothetical protein
MKTFSEALLWIQTTDVLWTIQMLVAIISISETILTFYISYKVIKNLFSQNQLKNLGKCLPTFVKYTLFARTFNRSSINCFGIIYLETFYKVTIGFCPNFAQYLRTNFSQLLAS